ncbi:MAG: FHA domain-containing protein, partial [Gammaproteobacteria bacterium]|nr:FHA domain-containing protein [Gammaproteobacteria bacterium]
VRTEMQEWGSALQSAQRERDTQLAALSAAQARAHTLEQQATHHEESLRSQQAQREEGVTRLRELEADLAAAEEALHRVEAESRARAEQLLQLEQRLAARAAPLAPPPAVTPLAAVRTEEGGVLREGVRRGEQVEGPPAAAAEGATRLLIRSEDGREIVHVLSRKTSVGRTPDNDLQIDAKFISRHHAVILCGPAQTIIEDLNSTNGVHVNGRRITRQVLQDGDSVAIGRQQYRFVVRKGGDKR